MQPDQALRKNSIQIAVEKPFGFLAFGLGSGLSPRAPGTVGTLVGMLLWIPFVNLPTVLGLVFVITMFMIGIRICDVVSHALGVHDHGGIVWDEIVGIWLVLAFIPFDWRWWLAAFVLFRIFDIAKPWPIGWLDRRITGGLGIMMDDVIAAFYTLAVFGLVGWLMVVVG